MQSVRSRIWTRVAVSISCDDNHYTTGTFGPLIVVVFSNDHHFKGRTLLWSAYCRLGRKKKKKKKKRNAVILELFYVSNCRRGQIQHKNALNVKSWCVRVTREKYCLVLFLGNYSSNSDKLSINWRCLWCNGYCLWKWTRRYEFKSWTRLIAFHIALIPLGKVWIQLFSPQLWVNSRTDWVSSALVRQLV